MRGREGLRNEGRKEGREGGREDTSLFGVDSVNKYLEIK